MKWCTKFEVFSFTGFGDIIENQISQGSRDLGHAPFQKYYTSVLCEGQAEAVYQISKVYSFTGLEIHLRYTKNSRCHATKATPLFRNIIDVYCGKGQVEATYQI